MTEQTISIERMEEAVNLFGSFDENIRIIERELSVAVVSRDGELKVSGEGEDVLAAVQAINGLLTYSSRGEQINEQNVRYILQLVRSGNADKIGELAGDALCVTAKGKPIKAKTIGQKRYVEAIRKNTVTLGIGPAGTGKTYLAVAAAVAAFRGGQVNRIILTRPAVEAGERLGFLPQGLQARTVAEGNTSLRGAALLLTRPELRERLVRWSSGCTLVDLAARPDFTALYMRHMVFG